MRTIALALVLLLSLTILGQDKDKFGKILIDDDQSYLVLSTKKIQTMEKELDDVSSRGFRVVYGAPTQQYDMARASKDPGSQAV